MAFTKAPSGFTSRVLATAAAIQPVQGRGELRDQPRRDAESASQPPPALPGQYSYGFGRVHPLRLRSSLLPTPKQAGIR